MIKKISLILLYIITFIVGIIFGSNIILKNENKTDNQYEQDNINNLGYYKVEMYVTDDFQKTTFNNIEVSLGENGNIKINDKLVANTVYSVTFTIKDKIIIIETSGTDIGGQELYIYNDGLEKLLTINYDNNKYEEEIQTIQSSIYNNTIYIELNNISHGPAINLMDGNIIDFYKKDGNEFDYDNLEKYGSLIAVRTLVVDYIGNGKISELKSYSEETIKDYFE